MDPLENIGTRKVHIFTLFHKEIRDFLVKKKWIEKDAKKLGAGGLSG